MFMLAFLVDVDFCNLSFSASASSIACELVSVSSTSLAPPTFSSLPTSVRSDSVSPYAECDDDSFADFVAKEALTSAMGGVGDGPHSPTHNPSHHLTNSDNIHVLLNHLHQESPGPSSEGASALVSQFGVTAACPPTPALIPEGAQCSVSKCVYVLTNGTSRITRSCYTSNVSVGHFLYTYVTCCFLYVYSPSTWRREISQREASMLNVFVQ